MKLKYEFFYYFIVSETFTVSVQWLLVQRSKQLEIVTNARTYTDTHTHSLAADYCYECICNYCDRQRRITSPGRVITKLPPAWLIIVYRITPSIIATQLHQDLIVSWSVERVPPWIISHSTVRVDHRNNII